MSYPLKVPRLDPELFDVPLPPGRLIRQRLPDDRVADVTATVRAELARPEVQAAIPTNGRIGIAVGSRGLAALPELVAAVVASVRAAGGDPVIIPAMGSHGGATSAGQADLLAGYGVTPERVGAPLDPAMEAVEVGRLTGGTPIYTARSALACAGVIVINRVKPHTLFHGEVESGLIKMLALGLGKQKGAASLHALGFETFPGSLIEGARLVLNRAPIICCLATVENALEQVAHVEAVLPSALLERERALLEMARRLMGRLPFPAFDVLVVDQIGKNISGDGMDPNVTGRYLPPGMLGEPVVQKIAVLDLTPETHGNACGLGVADVTTRRVLEKIDLAATYTNSITSTVLTGSRLPVLVETDEQAVRLAVRTCNRVRPPQVDIVRIQNTLELSRLWVSEPLWQKNAQRPELAPLSEPRPLPFSADGRLVPLFSTIP